MDLIAASRSISYFRIVWTLLIIFCISDLSGQKLKEDKIEILDNYVEFLNASVHGLSIAHVIFVNYNKVINKYVDINSYDLTQISNKDLPLNIFGGSDSYLNFYDQTDTPENLGAAAKANSIGLEIKLKSTLDFHVDNILNNLSEINQIRFDVENYIQNHDLNDRTAIYGVYEILERATDLFDEYASTHHVISELLDNNGRQADNDLQKTMSNIQKTVKIILSSLRRGEGRNSTRNLSQLNIHLKNFKIANSKADHTSRIGDYFSDIEQKVEAVCKKLDEFESTGFVPKDEEPYGKYYYYHNFLLRYVNWYGPGYIRSMNALIDEMDLSFIYYDEEPLIYKVLYPMKIHEIDNIGPTKTTALGKEKPVIGSRTLKFSNPKIISNGEYIELEIYDYRMLDKDTISINYNGEWILKNHPLTFEARKIELKLDKNKNNLLVIQAENLGIIPPNTLAISYRYRGERKRVFMESDLQVSEAIQIVLEAKNK